MPLSWQEAFLGSVTGLGGIVATAVTIVKTKSSNPDMPEIPPAALANLAKLADSNQAVLIQMAEFSRDLDHLKGDLKLITKRMEVDHRNIKLLREILISWGKMDAQREKPVSDTETGEL